MARRAHPRRHPRRRLPRHPRPAHLPSHQGGSPTLPLDHGRYKRAERVRECRLRQRARGRRVAQRRRRRRRRRRRARPTPANVQHGRRCATPARPPAAPRLAPAPAAVPSAALAALRRTRVSALLAAAARSRSRAPETRRPVPPLRLPPTR